MTPPLPLDEAQRRLLEAVEPLPTERVPLIATAGRLLTEPLAARRSQPAADLSAMDGYAMRGGEAGPWRVVGESAAGHPYGGELAPGEAVRISTGALMPAGGNRLEFVRARLEGELAAPLGEQDSSALRALAAANALIERPIDAPPAPAGTLVPVYLLENGGTA